MIEQLFSEGDLVYYVPDLQRRLYRVSGNPVFENGDWWYRFHKTGQGGHIGYRSEPKLPQSQLVHANAAGDIFGTYSINS